jgi:hypothetical protein
MRKVNDLGHDSQHRDDQQEVQGSLSDKTAEVRQPDGMQAATTEGETKTLVTPKVATRIMFKTWRI